ncbi:hypothetical protein UFOVP239_48 [uncultured Caudovirales phage]|uniref:Uncharacterized protein n=1 Tax=uncultured Caudovirales phage TaxID=2100421 RepID=A0A6J7WQA2_9CAUD|nr:hypothetical protein UFOVP239_48 [uncultured Caudovirales phage]
MSEQRIYKVTNGEHVYLVQAITQAQALRHIAGRIFNVKAATALDVAHLMPNGIKVEIASMTVEPQIEIKE